VSPQSGDSRLEPNAFLPEHALEAGQLPEYIRSHNSAHHTRLHIWERTQDEAKTDRPHLLRFLIPDVTTIYISIGYQGPNGTILIENMSAFAPRERVGHNLRKRRGHADRLRSPEGPLFALRVHSLPTVVATTCSCTPCTATDRITGNDGQLFTCFVYEQRAEYLQHLLKSYEQLFEDRCAGCGRVLSVEGHVPPVVRLWRETGEWEPRHVTCRQQDE